MRDMTAAEAHAIAVAVQTRREELGKWMDWYKTNVIGRGWATSEMAAEHAIRHDELDRILKAASQAPLTEGEAREMSAQGH